MAGAAFFHGSPKPDPKPGQKPFWEVPHHPRSEVERLRKGQLSSDEGLLTLGLAILGPHYSTYDVAVDDFKLAREFGLIASMHCAGAAARTPDGWDRLRADVPRRQQQYRPRADALGRAAALHARCGRHALAHARDGNDPGPRSGKQADLVVLRADDLNMWPVHDPVTTVVLQTSRANIE